MTQENSPVNIFQIGNKELHISEHRIHWENQLFDSVIEQPTEIRFGAAPIELDMFTIGTNYKIQLRNKKNDRLNVSLKSYFGIGRTKKYELFNQIADITWDYFFADHLADLTQRWEGGETISVGAFELDRKGITRKTGSKSISIRFDELKILARFDHLLLNSTEQSDKFIKLNYLKDWNWPVVNEIINRAINTDVNKR